MVARNQEATLLQTKDPHLGIVGTAAGRVAPGQSGAQNLKGSALAAVRQYLFWQWGLRTGILVRGQLQRLVEAPLPLVVTVWTWDCQTYRLGLPSSGLLAKAHNRTEKTYYE